MKVKQILGYAFLLFVSLPSLGLVVPKSVKTFDGKVLSLVWHDEFEQKSKLPNPKKWVRCERGKSDWNNYMSDRKDLVEVKKGQLFLHGIVNPDKSKDPVPFLTGGLITKGKFAFKYGKIEIRAKFNSAQGCWPALWMLGEKGKWPANGEIDLMEHLNFDDFVYQTVHSDVTYIQKRGPQHSGRGKINKDDFNVYGAEWDENKIVFTINGKSTFTYKKDASFGVEQYPFNQPFYLLFSMQIEGSWVGKANAEQYPTELIVDWVRVYQ